MGRKKILSGEPADYLCNNRFRTVIDELKQFEPTKLVDIYNTFFQMPRPSNIRLSDLTLNLLTLGFISSALYETKVDRSIIKGSPMGGLGVIITTENDVPRWDFHQFQMAYAKFEPGTGYRTQFNGRSGYQMIADNALNNAEFFDRSATLAQINMGNIRKTDITKHDDHSLWAADFGDKVNVRYKP